MTKEVKLYIKGVQKYDTHEDNDLETKANGEYYLRGDCHYILYEEYPEGVKQPIKNMLKIKSDSIEMVRRGLVNTSMIFDRKKQTVSHYKTPFGELLLGIDTKTIRILESDDFLCAEIEYALAAEGQHMADCRISIQVRSLK